MKFKNKIFKMILNIFKISIEKYKEFERITEKKDEDKSMEIKVKNNVPDVEVNINQNDDGSLAILLTQMRGKTLDNVKPGNTITIGKHEYIVLGHDEGTTAIIAKNPIKSMSFGKDGDYIKSDIRAYCNGDFYKELCKAVGEHNIIPHIVDLIADDGSNKGVTVKDNVSILTNDRYRRYREFLPAIGSSCWTATRVTTLDKDYARSVCVVGSDGILRWYGCGYSYGVRPFCILNSSVLVS